MFHVYYVDFCLLPRTGDLVPAFRELDRSQYALTTTSIASASNHNKKEHFYQPNQVMYLYFCTLLFCCYHASWSIINHTNYCLTNQIFLLQNHFFVLYFSKFCFRCMCIYTFLLISYYLLIIQNRLYIVMSDFSLYIIKNKFATNKLLG